LRTVFIKTFCIFEPEYQKNRVPLNEVEALYLFSFFVVFAGSNVNKKRKM
jgi:hypothetical protein